MKLKSTFLIFLFLGVMTNSFAQKSKFTQEATELTTLHPYVKKHGFSTELFGSFSIGSFLYETPILKKPNYFINFKTGLGSMLGPTLPHSVSFNFGKKKHYFELGYQGTLGYNFQIAEDGWFWFYAPSPIVGYRYYDRTGFIKIYGTALIPIYGGTPLPFGGIGAGFYFSEIRRNKRKKE